MVVLTLTVGIGINASVFTVVDGTVLKPHVYRDPASFVRIVPMSQRDGRTARRFLLGVQGAARPQPLGAPTGRLQLFRL